MKLTVEIDLDNGSIDRFNSLARAALRDKTDFMDFLEEDILRAARKIDRRAQVEIEIDSSRFGARI